MTTIKTTSSCGCLTAFLVLFVVAAPAALFPGPLAVLAYILLGVFALLGGVGWVLQRKRQTAPPMPPPAPAPPR